MESMNDLKQMGKDCMQLINKKMAGQIDSKQFCDAIIELGQKYPIPGHNPPLSTYQLKHYGLLMQRHEDPDTRVEYWDHLQPWNFDEAAQMYYWHSKSGYGKEKEQPDLKSRAAGEYEEEVPF